MRRVILHLNDDSDGVLALRAAIKDGHLSCVYSFGDTNIYAYHTQTGVAAREDQK
jgi:hypothetical protein